jgi:hypothetical protein
MAQRQERPGQSKSRERESGQASRLTALDIVALRVVGVGGIPAHTDGRDQRVVEARDKAPVDAQERLAAAAAAAAAQRQQPRHQPLTVGSQQARAVETGGAGAEGTQQWVAHRLAERVRHVVVAPVEATPGAPRVRKVQRLLHDAAEVCAAAHEARRSAAARLGGRVDARLTAVVRSAAAAAQSAAEHQQTEPAARQRHRLGLAGGARAEQPPRPAARVRRGIIYIYTLLSMPRGRCISQLQMHNRLVNRNPLAKAIVRPWERELYYRTMPGWRSRLLDPGRVSGRVAARTRCIY